MDARQDLNCRARGWSGSSCGLLELVDGPLHRCLPIDKSESTSRKAVACCSRGMYCILSEDGEAVSWAAGLRCRFVGLMNANVGLFDGMIRMYLSLKLGMILFTGF